MSVFKKDSAPVTIKVDKARVSSINQINVLGVIFYSKLQWCPHILRVMEKSNKSLNAIKLIRRHFISGELIQLLTSNYYSVQYFNSEIWLMKSVHHSLNHSLITASANACKVALHYPRYMLSYQDLHMLTN